MRLHDRTGEHGSAAIEAVIGISAFVMLGSLVIAGGRVAITHQAVESAAAQAARQASITRAAPEAGAAATAAAGASLANQDVPCVSQGVVVDTSGFVSAPGVAAQVSATVTCTVDLSDVALPGVPGRMEIQSTMTSPIDTYRER